MGLHASTFPMLTALLAQMSGATQPIEVILDKNVKKEIEENRNKLASIADAVLYCGRLGLPLHGHRDDSKYHPEVGQYSTGGVGNFIETLNLKVRSGDKVLENHLKTCGKKKSYISKTSQDKMIKCFGQIISKQIVNDIKESKLLLLLLMRLQIHHTKSIWPLFCILLIKIWILERSLLLSFSVSGD